MEDLFRIHYFVDGAYATKLVCGRRQAEIEHLALVGTPGLTDITVTREIERSYYISGVLYGDPEDCD